MNNQIGTFVEFLLDTEATSEVSFNQAILKNEFFNKRYKSSFENVVNQKLQLWKDYYQKEQRAIADRIAINAGAETSDHESETDSEEESFSDSEEGNTKQSTSSHQKDQVSQSIKQPDVYIDPIGQCKRLLQLLYHCQQDHVHFTDLYFHTLDQCIKSDNEEISAIGLQQIALHLSNTDKDCQRLIKYLPHSSTIPESHKPILSTIQTLLSTKQDQTTVLSTRDLDILYPQTGRFLDLRREFRDSTHYFIDGDSLILSVAHHINIDLISYFGNTVHVIFIIERILLTLFNQTHQCNYTLLFFDCHYQIYQEEKSILSLLRACLIAHLSRNTDSYRSLKLQQFSSWLDMEYQKFTSEEKPHFIFYHDISSLDLQKNNLLSEKTLNRLLCVYRLFGNYHQYHLQCHLYLMNRLILTDTSVKCFHVRFQSRCSMGLFQKVIGVVPIHRNKTSMEEDDWMELEKMISKQINQDDVRLFIYLKTIIEFNEKDMLPFLSPLLVLHVTLLIRLSLIDRHLPLNFPSIKFSPRFSFLISQFQQSLAWNISSYSTNLSWSKIVDIFDGRLFAFTLHQLHQSSSKIYFDSNTMDIVQKCLIILKLPKNKNILSNSVKQLIQSKDIIITSPTTVKDSVLVEEQKVTRISNPFIDTLLKPILSRNDKLMFKFVNPEEHHLSRYKGKYHWHVYKEVGDEISRIRDNDEQNRNPSTHRYRTRNQQKFYTYFTLYGKSLTSRDLKDNQLQIFLPTASTPALKNDEATRNDSASDDGKKQKRKSQSKQIPQKKADKIREEQKQQKLEKRTEDETEQIAHVEDRLKEIPIEDYSKAIEFIDQSLSSFETSANRLKLLKRKFRLQRKYLESLKKKNVLTTTEKSQLDLLQIGYFATMTEMAHLENIVDVFDQKTKYMEELIDHSPLDHEIWYRFQLEKINSRLPRREQGVLDSRVLDFIPDQWQVDFLDAVDKQQSIIIVAPTASGKTYASYYAMNKVLKDASDSHGICVYIAPTKALVNQVAASIHSKFGAVFGIFTRDYRMNMNACRILVTVPQCMEILLLSPNHQRWCQQIKYAIFDEIHCMSGEGGSDVWEKTMLLINCPMIGLSATVNNGEELCQWIEHVENQRSKLFKTSKPRRVRFIVHHERMADLNKYLYTNRQLYPIHPVGVMNATQLITRGVPKDFSLSPCETLQLHDAMKKVSTDISLPTLTQSFSPGWVVERSLCNNYSRLVYNQFNQLIDTKNKSNIDKIATSLQPITSNINYPELKAISKLIIDFILTLKEKNLLPCIVFSDSRILCEDMAASVAGYFEKIEKDLRKTKYRNRVEELNNSLELIETARKKNKPQKQKKSSGKRNHAEDNIEELKMVKQEKNQILLSGLEQQLLYGILDEGSLANRHGCDRELADALLERASKDNPRLVRYMKRGIAYHHAGLNNKGRVAVEALFRNRYIQVVFSTPTLALGIHMPTKTVAFVQDSIYLDALQYRQSSGRAGRRGFDVQGHVVFVDIPLTKIRHLMISAIPNIHAHFPTSVTFLMRLLHLYSNAKDSNDAMNRSLIALECPLLAQSSMKKDLVDIQTRFHGLFTLDFLYRLNLINGKGDLTGLAGLLTHLHYFEPANILLVYLMDTQLFHVVKDPLEIMTVFAYLFTNMPWLITRYKQEDLTKQRKESKFNSRLFLPPISKEFRKRVEMYNTIVKDVYGCYIENVTQALRSINDERIEILPFSNISFAQQNADYDDGSFEYQLHHHQSQQTLNPSISPFAGPSGLTHQDFMSNYNPINGSWDLAYDLDLSSKIVPFVDIDCRDHTNTAYHLNSYALDFYRHGSEKLLIMENELNPGDTYSLLLDFKLVLSSIATSLEVIVKNEQERAQTDDLPIFVELFQSLSNVQRVFSRNFQRQYPNQNR